MQWAVRRRRHCRVGSNVSALELRDKWSQHRRCLFAVVLCFIRPSLACTCNDVGFLPGCDLCTSTSAKSVRQFRSHVVSSFDKFAEFQGCSPSKNTSAILMHLMRTRSRRSSGRYIQINYAIYTQQLQLLWWVPDAIPALSEFSRRAFRCNYSNETGLLSRSSRSSCDNDLCAK